MEYRHRVAASAVVIACAVGVHAARADHRPMIAVPGNWQVPVTIDGIPATGAMVVGDWGLYAPGRIAPEIIGPVLVPSNGERGYYPKTGRRPASGRQEVFVPSRPPPPAPSFHREWSVESDRIPASEYPQFDLPGGAGAGQMSDEPFRPAQRRERWNNRRHPRPH